MSSSTHSRIESEEAQGRLGLEIGDTLRAVERALSLRELLGSSSMTRSSAPGSGWRSATCYDLRERLTDGLIDKLLVGRRGETEILGPDGLLGDLARRPSRRASGSARAWPCCTSAASSTAILSAAVLALALPRRNRRAGAS